jgi:UDP:flavonoid glycosyltransferase YjiC (YdhE family)
MSESELQVLLPTIGSAGDVHPMIELGLALQARGHAATIVTNPWFEQQVRDSGLGFAAMGTLEEADAILNDARLWHPTKSFEFIAERAIIPNIERLYEIIRTKRAPNTVVAASGFCFGAQIAHEKLGVPLATVHLQPTMLRSDIGGGMQGWIYIGAGVPRRVKRSLLWLLDKMVIDRVLAPPINAVRGKLGLAPVSRIMKSYVHSPQLVIGLFPEWFAAPQLDWPPNTHLVGFVLHDASEQFPVSAEVDEFLAAEAPPVVFTPGSAASTMTAFFRESVEACKITGQRAMLVTNFPEQLPRELPPNVRAFSYLPFSKILKRCAALVYPGGIGTMAQAIKAGIPHLVVPHAHDQPDNALRLERLGLGRRIYPEKYTAERAAGLLREVVGSAEIRRKCAEFAGKIDSRVALDKASGLIEGLGGVI